MTLISFISAALLALASCAPAQDGYVVKTEGSAVYLDITKSSRAPAAGTRFLVYEDGAELVNPVTHENLGRTRVSIATGAVTQVQPKFAAGEIAWKRDEVRPGQFFAWLDNAAAPTPAADWTAQAAAIAAPSPVIWKSSAPLDYTAVALALGDFDGGGENELALASEKTIKIYRLENGALAEKYSASLGGLYRILSLDAEAGAGKGGARIFASLFDNFSGDFQTAVFEIKDGLRQTATLGWLTRAACLSGGGKRLYGQEIYRTGELKKSQIRPLEFKGDSVTLSTAAIDIPRFDWVYGFDILAETGGRASALLITAPEGRMRAQFGTRKNYFETDADYGGTPNVLRVSGEKLSFYPRAPVKTGGEQPVLYVLSGVAKEGLLSEAFARYKDARLRALRWTGMGFETAGEILLGGSVYDIDSGRLGALDDGIIAAVIGPDDTTTVKLFKY